jgi:MarR family transcriptional regulator, transcriptional regulator for hemolysin
MTDTDLLPSAFASALPNLHRAWRRESDAALAEYGLSFATAMPLVAIGRLGDGVRQVAVADALAIEEASLSPVLNQLCAAGLVERRTDSRDRRARALHMTPTGKIAARKAELALAAVRRRLLAGAKDDDVAAAVRVFRAIEDTVGRGTLPPVKAVA